MTIAEIEHESCQHLAYQMTCDEFNELIARAAGRCEICGVLGHLTPQEQLHIDHDATLGMWAVRGLLCSRCNTKLGRPGLMSGPEVDAYLARPWRSTPPTVTPKLVAQAAMRDATDDVVNAYNAIEEAWENYRKTLRACIEEGNAEGKTGRQVEISRRIGRTRETLRQDAMTHEQREALRQAEAERRKAKKVSK